MNRGEFESEKLLRQDMRTTSSETEPRLLCSTIFARMTMVGGRKETEKRLGVYSPTDIETRMKNRCTIAHSLYGLSGR